MDVAIVGIGMHPFGRTPTMTGLEQGAAAARALAGTFELGQALEQVRGGALTRRREPARREKHRGARYKSKPQQLAFAGVVAEH